MPQKEAKAESEKWNIESSAQESTTIERDCSLKTRPLNLAFKLDKPFVDDQRCFAVRRVDLFYPAADTRTLVKGFAHSDIIHY
jgi:hypothetical protein